MANVLFNNVYKRYGNVTAVTDLNLEIRDQEFMVLVGPSGCGKSTALRMIAGLEDISDGTISIGERVVNNVAPKDRDIAMVFQNYALYPHMNVFDNMAFALKLRHMPKDQIKKKVDEVAGSLGIEKLLARKPRQLSGGQRQRVALGRAIVREPQVFLMDEPLSNLDAKMRVQTRAELEQAPPTPPDHHRVRHARPGRGDDDGGPYRGDEGWVIAAGGYPAQHLQQPGQYVRGRLHRDPGYEYAPYDRRTGRGGHDAPHDRRRCGRWFVATGPGTLPPFSRTVYRQADYVRPAP